jgi:nucleotide-binding universal stress UspA family protein
LPLIPEPTMTMAAARETILEGREHRRHSLSRQPAAQSGRRGRRFVSPTKIVEGTPKSAILEEAERYGADLIMVGAHGFGAVARLLLGSVSQALALHAPCSVEIVRSAPCPKPSQEQRS